MEKKIVALKEIFKFPYQTANYLLNISNKYNYIYFENPKVGCSTIKRTLQIMETNDKTLLDMDVHNKTKSPLLSPLQLVNPITHHLKSHFKFSFVRNPYTRILSCYLDKIVGNEWERNIRLPKIGYSPNDNLTFEEFLLAIRKFPIEKWDIHWMPQTILLAHNKVKMDFIGRLEYFDLDFKKVIAFLKKEPFENSNIVNVKHHSVGANKKLQQYLTKKCEDLIKEIYYDDFKAFGYGFNPNII